MNDLTGTRVDVPGVDRSTLTPVARRILRSEIAEVVDWRAGLIYGKFSKESFTGGGIFRISGTALDLGQTRPWSVVLKVSGTGNEEPTSRQYWKRELLAYQSGLLDDLGGGLVAPRFFGGEEREGQRTWLWLEEIKADPHSQRWPVSRFGLAGRHFGQMQGPYLTGRPLPDHPWLHRNVTRQPNTILELSVEEMWDRYPTFKDHPLVRHVWPGDYGERAYRIWQERESFLEALDRLPQVFSHLDLRVDNLLPRHRPDGVEETVVIDWAFSGLAAVGHDVHKLGRGTAFTCEVEPDQIPELGQVVFDGYVEGLHDSGWRGDVRLARLGFTASLALSVTFPEAIWMTLDQAKQVAQMQGQTLEEMAETQVGRKLANLEIADEARGLLPLVGL